MQRTLVSRNPGRRGYDRNLRPVKTVECGDVSEETTISDTTPKQAQQALSEGGAGREGLVECPRAGPVSIDPGSHRIVGPKPPALQRSGVLHREAWGGESHTFIFRAGRAACPVTEFGPRWDTPRPICRPQTVRSGRISTP